MTYINKRDTELLVCDKMCDECLYSKNKLVSDSRKEQILYQLEQVNDYFICHKASLVNERVMCRGYYEKNKTDTYNNPVILLAAKLKVLKFVNVIEVMKSGIYRMRNNVKL